MSLAERIIRWYDTNARDLPWRRPDVTPWAVLVSEVMLQQTQVRRVLPAYRDWLRRWPNAAALAEDSPAEAIRMWGRLGYPRRALRLHACARTLMERHDGQVPDDVDALLALPGIGRYTARAVAAFAFGQRVPVVDTNVRRVATRLVNGVADAAASAGDLDLVAGLLPADPARAARMSVALMEFGALVCTARAPGCDRCPVRGACAWLRAGAPTVGPVRRTQRYAGTDRQVRGLLLGVLRDAPGPVERVVLDAVWTDPEQRERALTALIADGLAIHLPGGRFALPTTSSDEAMA